jgi:autotransporter-associated beta strand protein
VVSVANQTTTINAVLVGSQGLVKFGTGTLTLGGANTLTGTHVVSQGTLAVTRHNAIAGTSLTLGDASTGANATTFKVSPGTTAAVPFTAINTSSFGTGHTITLDSGGSLGANAPALNCTLNLAGNVPLTLKATNTGGHSTAQDWNGRITGTGIAGGSTALVLDGSAYALRLSFGNSSNPNTFTGDVLMQGFVTTQNQTYSGNIAANQNNGFLLNNLTVASGGTWNIVWGGETMGALNGQGSVNLNCQSAFNNVGLTLGNTNTNGLFSGIVAGGFGVTKIGTGMQTFAGSNTYTGPTAINGGTLLINGSQANTATTVAAAGTLGGTGTIAGSVSNSGTLAPGSSGVGNLTINNTLTMAAGSKLAWEVSNWTGAAGTGWDKLTVTLLNITATNASRITIRPTDLALANFSETNTSFVIAQTTSGITGFSADKFSVDTAGLTLPHGTWAVQQSGNNLVLAYTAQTNPDANGNGIFDTWETARFGNANAGANLPDADPDKDGLSNLIEYALDTHPLTAGASPLVYDFEPLGDGKHLRLTVPKNPVATNLTCTIESCGALDDWSTTNTTIEADTATQLIVRDNFTTDTASKRFIRLKVQANP